MKAMMNKFYSSLLSKRYDFCYKWFLNLLIWHILAGNRVTLVMSRKENHNEILFMVYTL